MNEALIAALAAGGGAMLKGLWDYANGRRRDAVERHKLASDASAEFTTKLIDRIDKLEQRIDGHDKYCDQRIALAIEASEKNCAEEMKQLRQELTQRIEDISEPITKDIL